MARDELGNVTNAHDRHPDPWSPRAPAGGNAPSRTSARYYLRPKPPPVHVLHPVCVLCRDRHLDGACPRLEDTLDAGALDDRHLGRLITWRVGVGGWVVVEAGRIEADPDTARVAIAGLAVMPHPDGWRRSYATTPTLHRDRRVALIRQEVPVHDR